MNDCWNIDELEHVVANISFTFQTRGEVKMTLISPYDTPSEILSYRKNDKSSKGIRYFPFMTLFNWGESPRGKWKLMIETKNDENYGQIDHFSLIFFGSKSNKDSKSKQEERSKRSDELKLKKAFVPSESLIKKIYYDELDLSRKAKIETKQNV